MNATNKGTETMTNAINAEIEMVKIEMVRNYSNGPAFRELRRLRKLLEAAKGFEVRNVVCELVSEDCPTNGVTFNADDDATAAALAKVVNRKAVKVGLNDYVVVI
jgi:hypothetical protein